MIKLKARHKTFINKGIQRVYNELKNDYPGLQRVTILLACHPSMEDGGGISFYQAKDLDLEFIQDYFIDPCNVIVVAKSVTKDNKVTPLTWIKLEECGFTLYSSNQAYKETISL